MKKMNLGLAYVISIWCVAISEDFSCLNDFCCIIIVIVGDCSVR